MLETLKDFCEIADREIVLEILKKSCEQKEYTIREKAAQIALKYDFKDICESLKQDENYYVRAVFLNHQWLFQQIQMTVEQEVSKINSINLCSDDW